MRLLDGKMIEVVANANSKSCCVLRVACFELRNTQHETRFFAFYRKSLITEKVI